MYVPQDEHEKMNCMCYRWLAGWSHDSVQEQVLSYKYLRTFCWNDMTLYSRKYSLLFYFRPLYRLANLRLVHFKLPIVSPFKYKCVWAKKNTKLFAIYKGENNMVTMILYAVILTLSQINICRLLILRQKCALDC